MKALMCRLRLHSPVSWLYRGPEVGTVSEECQWCGHRRKLRVKGPKDGG